MKKNFALTEGFGHGFATCNMARALGSNIVVLPAKDTKEEFEAEAEKIYNNLSYFYPEIKRIAFEDREKYADAYDFRKDLINGNVPKEWWYEFAKTLASGGQFDPDMPRFESLENGLLFTPQKLISDGQCGATAAEQSLTPDLFNFLKSEPVQLVLGQHFNKVADLPAVEALATDFNLYVPGMTEDEEVFGIRGVQHCKYVNLYDKCIGAFGILGTHDWQRWCTRPEIHSVTLLNTKSKEQVEDMAEAFRAFGFCIHILRYSSDEDPQELKQRMQKAYESYLK